MGFTGEFVRSVFSRNRSIRTHDSTVRSNTVEKKKWVSVRSYLCGDEFNSVLAEEDSASIKSSEATVTQPIQEELADKGENRREETVENVAETKPESNIEQLNEEEAAVIIQTAYRALLSRRQNERIKEQSCAKELNLVTESPDWKSAGGSVEVQTGNSEDVFSVKGENMSVYHRMQHKVRTQVTKQKEDWDDSTVSSYVSKMRMQNRMEATTRRERALAYAFSQQLRICSKRKSTKSNSTDQNMSWSWLERWMATRLPETSLVESHATKQHDLFTGNQEFAIKNRFLDLAREEKESCGSNEVSVQFENSSVTSRDEKDGFKPETTKNNLKARRTVSRRKTVPSYQFTEENSKITNGDGASNARKDIRLKQKQAGSKSTMKSNAATASDK
ncbi:hypothetical protein L6164_031502 [Bauhinia variegata]|uniref:Uncharacterized protein n=1 Tax=Bauhinia variegata TaxID=167791 RepID=A0ACB9LFM3_BAUVA|nr:hypothetical protein L6164_031502 [Bauhinia variegata]